MSLCLFGLLLIGSGLLCGWIASGIDPAKVYLNGQGIGFFLSFLIFGIFGISVLIVGLIHLWWQFWGTV